MPIERSFKEGVVTPTLTRQLWPCRCYISTSTTGDRFRRRGRETERFPPFFLVFLDPCAREMKLAMIALLVHPIIILGLRGLFAATDWGLKAVSNPGAHGFSQISINFHLPPPITARLGSGPPFGPGTLRDGTFTFGCLLSGTIVIGLILLSTYDWISTHVDTHVEIASCVEPVSTCLLSDPSA